MTVLMTPPTVSIPKLNGVASMITKSSVSLLYSPQITPPYTAAPYLLSKIKIFIIQLIRKKKIYPQTKF